MPHPEPRPTVHSKLPGLGASIFTRMTEAANRAGAINLSQGFPNFTPDPALVAEVERALHEGAHQYAPANGLPALRQEVAALAQRALGAAYEPDTEVTITSGGTEALFSVLAAEVGPGDEVLVLDPAYDSYAPAVRLVGGTPVHVPLRFPGYAVDWDRVAEALRPSTRLLMLNTPHNPTGTALGASDIAALQALAARHDFRILSDEVYAHIRYDGTPHLGMSRYPDLAARSYVVGSFGKNLHVTGWKLGYVLAPAALSAELRKAHQFITFCTHTPSQWAVARYLAAHPAFEHDLQALYQEKKDRFAQLMRAAPLTPLPVQGSYFQCFTYDRVAHGGGEMGDMAFCEWLIERAGVAAIPVSAFYADGTDHGVIRLCFAKTDDTLATAAQRLAALPVQD